MRLFKLRYLFLRRMAGKEGLLLFRRLYIPGSLGARRLMLWVSFFVDLQFAIRLPSVARGADVMCFMFM